MKPDLTILACADLHCDDRLTLAGLSPVDSKTGEPLVLAQSRRMMRWIGETARAVGADLIACAGDVYERSRPSPAAEAVVADAFGAWCEVASTVVLKGNHDAPSGAGVHALEPLKSLRPGRLHVIDRPDPVVVKLFAVPDVHLFPVPYPSRSYLAADSESAEHTNAAISAALDQVLAAHAAAAGLAPGPTILLGHGTLRGARYGAHQVAPLSDIGIGTELFDAFGLSIWGHLHQRQRAPGCAWAGDDVNFTAGYVGSPDRHDFGEEFEPKGVSVFRLVDGRWTCEFVRYPGARHFCTLGPDEVEADAWKIEAEVASDGPRCIYRVVGDVTEAEYEQTAAIVRRLKAAGLVIANRCTVARTDRARVADVRADLGADGILDAVFVARADLAPRADVIRANVRELAGGAP